MKLEKAGVLTLLRGKKLAGVAHLPAELKDTGRLRNILRHYFFHGADDATATGSGTTADAVRSERATGKMTGGSFHTTAAKEEINGLTRWLRRNPNADPGDIKIAQDALADLRAALAGK